VRAAHLRGGSGGMTGPRGHATSRDADAAGGTQCPVGTDRLFTGQYSNRPRPDMESARREERLVGRGLYGQSMPRSLPSRRWAGGRRRSRHHRFHGDFHCSTPKPKMVFPPGAKSTGGGVARPSRQFRGNVETEITRGRADFIGAGLAGCAYPGQASPNDVVKRASKPDHRRNCAGRRPRRRRDSAGADAPVAIVGGAPCGSAVVHRRRRRSLGGAGGSAHEALDAQVETAAGWPMPAGQYGGFDVFRIGPTPALAAWAWTSRCRRVRLTKSSNNGAARHAELRRKAALVSSRAFRDGGPSPHAALYGIGRKQWSHIDGEFFRGRRLTDSLACIPRPAFPWGTLARGSAAHAS